MDLEEEIKSTKRSPINDVIERRLHEFSSFSGKSKKEWFSELCFCLLTANSKAKSAMAIQNSLGPDGFCSLCADDVRACIIEHKHRFHNNKTKYIMEARAHIDIKTELNSLVAKEGQAYARNWLAENIKGLGYKEASHFMRNVGFFDVAILDRHILRLMHDNGLIERTPNSLTRKRYLEIEAAFAAMAKKLDMSAAELDLRMWYLKTGEVLK